MRHVTRIAVALVALTLAVPAVADAGSARVRVRKDVKDLTDTERRAYVGAVLALKSAPSPYSTGLSYYDQFVAWHRELSRCDPRDPLMRDFQWSHGGPMFLAWHRAFVLLFERALRQVSGRRVAVPYWDWTNSKSTMAAFSDHLMGGNGDPADGYAVKTGPFRKGRWQLNVRPIGAQFSSSATPYITRHFGSFPTGTLPSAGDVRLALEAPLYDVAPYGVESDPAKSFRNALEGFKPPLAGAIVCGPDGVIAEALRPPLGMHNAVHAWVGGRILPEGGGARLMGTMLDPTSSPNDPAFFLHHAMIDRIWAKWQESHGVDSYLPRSGYPRNNADDVMQPFAAAGIRMTPDDVADIRRLGYRYDAPRSRRARLTWRGRAVPPISFRCGVVQQGA